MRPNKAGNTYAEPWRVHRRSPPMFDRERMKEIATHPSRNDWIAYIIGFPTFTAIATIPPMMVLAYFTVNSSAGRAPVWAIALVVAFGAAVAFWFIRRMSNRQYWHLTDTDLLGGRTGSIRLPLSSIAKVIVGLPAKWPIPGMDKLASPELKQAFVVQKGISLLLEFQDRSLLPLNLHAMPNGSALMTELVNRMTDRVEHDHPYTADEVKLLRRADPNALIRRT